MVPGMITAEDVFSYNGQMIIPKGLTLTDSVITRLEFYSIMSVRVEDELDTSVADNSNTANEEIPHSELIKSSKDFQEFKASFDETLSGFKDSINNIVTLNAPIDTDALLNDTKDLITHSKESAFSTYDL